MRTEIEVAKRTYMRAHNTLHVRPANFCRLKISKNARCFQPFYVPVSIVILTNKKKITTKTKKKAIEDRVSKNNTESSIKALKRDRDAAFFFLLNSVYLTLNICCIMFYNNVSVDIILELCMYIICNFINCFTFDSAFSLENFPHKLLDLIFSFTQFLVNVSLIFRR